MRMQVLVPLLVVVMAVNTFSASTLCATPFCITAKTASRGRFTGSGGSWLMVLSAMVFLLSERKKNPARGRGRELLWLLRGAARGGERRTQATGRCRRGALVGC